MSLTTVLAVFTVVVTAYFVAYNVSQFAMAGVAGRLLWRYPRRRNPRNLALVANLASPPLVSIVTPAHNEALTIVDSIRALLALEYEAREIVVVNDGSQDDTLAVLKQAFDLVEAPVAFDQPLTSAPLRGVYRSLIEPALVVIDKVNGGSKADAANAGINAASGRLVLVIDADTMLEPDALTRAAMPFLERPDTVAVGGYVAIANGCRIEHSRVTAVAMPRSWLARFQIVEYMRSFLLFRLACASQNGVALISGAFGLFRRDALIDVGGYDATAIGEDMDLTLRLQAYYRERKRPIRIAHVPLPVCWTQAPEDMPSLRAQRCRWRRGLLQVLWRRRRMIGNPRYGIVGMGVLPYIAFFEGLGPLLEFIGLCGHDGGVLPGFTQLAALPRDAGGVDPVRRRHHPGVCLPERRLDPQVHAPPGSRADCRVRDSRERRLSPVEFVVGLRRNGPGDDGQRRVGPNDAEGVLTSLTET